MCCPKYTKENQVQIELPLESDLGEVPALYEVTGYIPGSAAMNSCREITPRHARNLSAVDVI